MSHFYGTLQGGRGQATRCGHKSSGLTTVAASYSGAVNTELWYDEETKTDMVTVSMTRWYGNGTSKVLYRGPVGEYKPSVEG